MVPLANRACSAASDLALTVYYAAHLGHFPATVMTNEKRDLRISTHARADCRPTVLPSSPLRSTHTRKRQESCTGPDTRTSRCCSALAESRSSIPPPTFAQNAETTVAAIRVNDRPRDVTKRSFQVAHASAVSTHQSGRNRPRFPAKLKTSRCGARTEMREVLSQAQRPAQALTSPMPLSPRHWSGEHQEIFRHSCTLRSS